MRGFQALVADASPEAVAVARSVLEQDVADQQWRAQVGPALSQRDVARLLGKTEQAVSKDRRLLRLASRSGRPVYPIIQFDGRRQLPGVADVVRLLAELLEPLTIAAWLTGRNPALKGRRPVDALRAGETEAVMTVAGRLAARAA